jgi:hypothetical protein
VVDKTETAPESSATSSDKPERRKRFPNEAKEEVKNAIEFVVDEEIHHLNNSLCRDSKP